MWFGLKFRWKGVLTYWLGGVLSRCCSPRRVWGWAGLDKKGSETCVPSQTLSKIFPQKNSVKFVWNIDVLHVVCGMVAFLLGLCDIVSGFYRHKKLFCRQVSLAGLALLGLLPEQSHCICAGFWWTAPIKLRAFISFALVISGLAFWWSASMHSCVLRNNLTL